MKKKTKIGTVLCCSTALVSILGGYLLTRNNLFIFNESNEANEATNNNLETSIQVENMSVRHMNTIYNRNGSTSYVYSYTVSPENATHTGVTGALSFIDGTEGVEEFLSFSIDQNNKQFTITKIADFSHQAQLVLTANANPNATATITIDCKQHFLGYNNLNEKLYRHQLTDQNDLIVNDVKADGANSIGANNFSTVYTIASTQHWAVTDVSISNLRYLSGNAMNALDNAGITITDDFAINDVDFAEDFSLEDLADLVYADSTLFSDATVYACKNRSLFGVGFDYRFTYVTSGISKVFTVHMAVAASTSELDFGTPTSITVEEDHVVFEDAIASYRFVFTDSNGEVSYLAAQTANNTGWISSPYLKFGNGYINLEVTRTFEGNVITGPTLLFSDQNDGKGFFCGTSNIKQYVVYNPGPYENVHWNTVQIEFTPDFLLVNNFTLAN